MPHFIHSGDLGDVIYSLPVVKALGGGTIHLIDTPGMTAHPMSIERFASILPLLRVQPYITSICYNTLASNLPANVVDLNKLRSSGQDLVSKNLTHSYFRTFGLDVPAYEPWLAVSVNYRPRPVVFARSARYHNPDFPWQKIADRYRGRAVFVGTPAEHVAFVMEFGDVEYVHTPDLLAVACVIEAADLFVGNQSCPLAIAHGLGQRTIIEVCAACPNCIFGRPGELGVWGDFDPCGPLHWNCDAL